MITNSIKILKELQYPNGLFAASRKNVQTGYNKAWIRDCVYEALGMEKVDLKSAIKTYHALLDILLKHEWKINWAILNKPEHKHEYIHARFCPESLQEIEEEWGNKQNDAIGAFLFKIAQLTKKGINIIRHRHDFRILQKLVYYLASIEYWHDEDNGMWEENEEIHASSIGACLAALKMLTDTVFEVPIEKDDILFKDILNIKENVVYRRVHVPFDIIKLGQESLNALLPRESITKKTDLALLSLIYPYNIVSETQREQILENVHKSLVKHKGVIRYDNDYYYRNEFGEPQWTMGFPWLAIIYKKLGDMKKYHFFMYKTQSVMTNDGELPELYYAHTDEYNDNTPLGWSQALFLVASHV